MKVESLLGWDLVEQKIYLLARRKTDGRFLRLDEGQHTTRYDFVDEPHLAKRISPWDTRCLENPQPATYYFENSDRARELWLKDCEMVAYAITTAVNAEEVM